MKIQVAGVLSLLYVGIQGAISDVGFPFNKEYSIGYSLLQKLSQYSSDYSCSSSSQHVLDGLKVESLKEYSFRMLDSSGNFGSGVLNGNPHILGDYHECVSIRANEGFRGQFIVALSPYNLKSAINLTQWAKFLSAYKDMKVLPMPSHPYRHKEYGFKWNEIFTNGGNHLFGDLIEGFILQKPVLGLCVPSTCDIKTLQAALTSTINQFFQSITLNKLEKSPVTYYLTNLNYIQQDHKVFSTIDIATLVIIISFVILSIFGTGIDLLYDQKWTSKKFAQILLCFSVTRNAKSLLDHAQSRKGLATLDSLRFLSIVWIVLGHTWYIYTSMQQPSNLFKMTDFYGDWVFFPLFGAMSYPSVDTFFIVGGFLTAFITLKKLDKSMGSLNFVKAFIHRYIRLTPVYAIIILFCSNLIQHLGEGPFWNLMIESTHNCQKYWWTNLLYINNYVMPEFACMRPTWYLACDFQLYLLGILVMWILWKNEKLGQMLLFTLLIVSTLIPGVLTFINDWGPINTVSFRDPFWGNYFYQMTYTRASPYIYGMIFGYFLWKKNIHRERGLSKAQLIIGWSIFLIPFLSIMYGFTNSWSMNVDCTHNRGCFTTTEAVIFASIGRLSWGISISWLIYVCYKGYGGCVNTFLSNSIFLPLNRLGYVLYLVHFNVIVVFLFSRKEVTRFELTTMVYHFFGHLGVSLIISFFVSLIFEWPFYGVERILFEGFKKNHKLC
ncbi:nose resistant to fluoxetine protein 6-like [Lepeophtheirus salmonis]|uniref:nose resistant to fluoxetine protein 6-like n=1 Tax=Lepeophtheirus salmonis TaxID=72036 RepID=UPI003AF348E0